ncbi:DUF3784 domain-containing protein, partial [Lachnospiraceae bacterium OttesenSCG-928-J05]|nr:DUF3784 domain-containing protein [Lachnospiraceae bacterium OttesenSCG-928-J05]
MEDIFFAIIMGVVALIFIVLGYLLWVKQKISILHDYHYTKVKENDKRAYTRVMGIGMIVIGIGCLLSGIYSLFI